MKNYDLEELSLAKGQLYLTIAFIILLLVSLTLTYNQILNFQKLKPLYNNKTADNILKGYRVFGLLIAIGYLIIDIIDKNIKEKYSKNTKSATLQIDAGILTVIATVIVLYVAFMGNNETDIENPEV